MTNHIRSLRQQRGLSQQDLADALGTNKQQIGRLEKGERQLTESWIRRLCTQLGCTAADLLGYDGVPDFSEDEIALIRAIRGLNDADRQAILRFVSALSHGGLDTQN